MVSDGVAGCIWKASERQLLSALRCCDGELTGHGFEHKLQVHAKGQLRARATPSRSEHWQQSQQRRRKRGQGRYKCRTVHGNTQR